MIIDMIDIFMWRLLESVPLEVKFPGLRVKD